MTAPTESWQAEGGGQLYAKEGKLFWRGGGGTTEELAGSTEGPAVVAKTLKVKELSTLEGGLKVEGALTLPNESVKQNYIQGSLTTMQTPVRELAQF